MKIYSEKTRKEYKTVEDCLTAEKAYDADLAAKEAKKAKLANERKARAKAVEDAFQAAQDAQKHYTELRNQFVKDFGSFHMTFSNSNDWSDLWDEFFKFF